MRKRGKLLRGGRERVCVCFDRKGERENFFVKLWKRWIYNNHKFGQSM